MSKRLGIIRHQYAQPLFNCLHRFGSESSANYELVQDIPAQLIVKLLQDELDGVFISPIDYAKHYSQLRIVPNVCTASNGESGAIELHFHEDLKNLSTIAINPESSSEIVLARLLLEEKYDLSPQFVPMFDSVQTGLQKADAVLLVGNDCEQWKVHTNKLDLADEWFDLTELPYVHGFWALKDGALQKDDILRLQDVKIEDIHFDNEKMDFAFSYDFNDAAIQGLTEYYKMAYYYGVLKDIPNLNFLSYEENS